MGLPPKLDLNVTNRCNFRCAHCAFDSGCKAMPDLSFGTIKAILEETSMLGGKKVDLTGGEPTLRNDLDEILSCAKGLGYQVELVTNGSLLSPAWLEKLKSLGLDSFAISLDGSTYEEYAKIRNVPRETYTRVIENISLAINAGFKVKINALACQENYTCLPKIADYCIAAGAAELGIYYFTPIGRGEREGLHAVEPVAWLSFLREYMMPYKDKIEISLEFPLIEKGFSRTRETSCFVEGSRHHLQILSDGRAFPCCIMASAGNEIARIGESGISGVWAGKSLWDAYWQDMRALFSRNKGYCVAFSDFDIDKYKDNYELVCPLRKFTLQDLEVRP